MNSKLLGSTVANGNVGQGPNRGLGMKLGILCIPFGTHGVDEELTDADAQQVGATHRLVGEVLPL